jgi:hypothetical protein
MGLMVLAPGKSPKFVHLYVFVLLPWLIGHLWFYMVDFLGVYSTSEMYVIFFNILTNIVATVDRKVDDHN